MRDETEYVVLGPEPGTCVAVGDVRRALFETVLATIAQAIPNEDLRGAVSRSRTAAAGLLSGSRPIRAGDRLLSPDEAREFVVDVIRKSVELPDE